MVSYSFKPSFVRPIQLGIKQQTIRLPRKRHARPGEPVQLFTGMRTRACRKLLDPDPICAGVSPVELDVGRHGIGICVNGCELKGDDAIAFAEADGFAPVHHGVEPAPGIALLVMARWWALIHGVGRFEGVLVTWRPA